MEKKLLLEDHIRKNKRDTILICSLMAFLFLGVIFAFSYLYFNNIYIALFFGLPVAIVYVLITYSFSVQTVISAAKARPANPSKREEKLLIYKVEEMAIASGLPQPKVYVQDSEYINAFATGKKPANSIICVTTGALQKLNTQELEGVIGHEMSHIKNQDILVATVTIGVVGAIALIAEILWYSMFWGGAGRNRRDQGNAIILVLAIVFIILAPIFSRLTYFAISRRREYLADSNGAYFTRNPEGLARALEKIKNDIPREKPKGSRTVAPLYIANPFKELSHQSIWSTHPPLDERIRRLRSM
ncbi:MAG: M48 family metallopeptidase [Candidatus Thermoplasmatota archaeon]|nr:M48 family metallopeptidase [Candidatus Thermoplasmatota archaeon]MBU1940687.1 M48 family metallopeptidase [Candidatus Thermoplasmatota archaeon]